MMAVSEVLGRALAEIEAPEHWCTNWRAKLADGTPTFSPGPEAVSFCALGALDRVRGFQVYSDDDAVRTLDAAIPGSVPYPAPVPWAHAYAIRSSQRVAAFNNASDHETVVAWFKRAIRRAKEREAIAVEVPAPPREAYGVEEDRVDVVATLRAELVGAGHDNRGGS